MQSDQVVAHPVHLRLYAVSVVIMAVFCLFILLYHAIQACKHRRKHAAKPLLYKTMSAFTMMSMVFFTITVIDRTLGFFTCNPVINTITSSTYLIAKAFMYLLFILRLHYVYRNSIYAYNRSVLLSVAIVIVIFYIMLAVWACIVNIDAYEFSMFGYHLTVCQRAHPSNYLIVTTVIDLLSTVITLLAYIWPLMKIMRSLSKEYTTNYNDEDLKYPVVKASLLTLTAITTSSVAHIGSIYVVTDTLFVFDVPLNCVCIMLMSSYYNKSYETLCCVLIACVSWCTLKENVGDNTVSDIQQHPNTNDRNTDMSHFDTGTLGDLPTIKVYENDVECTETAYA